MICNDFCAGLMANGSRIRAAAARDAGRAADFGARVGAEVTYGNYAALLEDQEVSVVYVGVIHPAHFHLVQAAIEAGKHVLCEKPMCLTADQTEKLCHYAQSRGVFLMEAMWTRFFPAVQRAQQVLASGALGAPRGVQANFGFNLPFDREHRLFSKEKGGGAALDIGCYCVQWGTMVFGSSGLEQVASTGNLAPTGVDVDGAISMSWEGKGTVSVQFGVNAVYPEETVIFCEKGYLKICSPAHAPTRLEVYESAGRSNQLVEVFEEALPAVPVPVNFPNSEGMVYQVQHVEKCLSEGRTESPLYPLSETITVAKVLDSFLSNVGVDYNTV